MSVKVALMYLWWTVCGSKLSDDTGDESETGQCFKCHRQWMNKIIFCS
jgi:hypothetical protein